MMAELKVEFEAIANQVLIDHIGGLATALHEISLLHGESLFIDNPDRDWYNDPDREWALRTTLQKARDIALEALGNTPKE